MASRSEAIVTRETRSTPAGPIQALVVLDTVDVGSTFPAGTVLEHLPKDGYAWRAVVQGDPDYPDGYGVPAEMVEDLIRMDEVRRQRAYRDLQDGVGHHVSDLLTDAPTLYAILADVPEAGVRKGDGILHLPCAELSRPSGYVKAIVRDLGAEDLDRLQRAAEGRPECAVNISRVWDAFRFRPDLSALLSDPETRMWSIRLDDYGRAETRAPGFLHVRPIVSNVAEPIEASSEAAALRELVAESGGRLDF